MTELPHIGRWIEQHGWDQLSWRDHFGRGVWTAIAPPTYTLELIRDVTQGKGQQQNEIRDALLESTLLPIRTGPNLGQAMQALEGRLAALPEIERGPHSLWAATVSDLYENYREMMMRAAAERSMFGVERERVRPHGERVLGSRDGSTRHAPAAMTGAINSERELAQPAAPAEQAISTTSHAREHARHLAARIERACDVKFAHVPPNRISQGRLVRVETHSKSVALAAVVTPEHVHVFTVASPHNLRRHVGSTLSIEARAGQVRIVDIARTPALNITAPKKQRLNIGIDR
jgi:hypothetical protein